MSVKSTLNALHKTRHVFLKQGCPRRQQSKNLANSPSPTFSARPTPGACDVSEL